MKQKNSIVSKQAESEKIIFSKVFLVILLLSIIGAFLIWYSYPNEQKGTIDDSGLYYPGALKYNSTFLILGVIYYGLAFLCFLRMSYLFYLRFRSLKNKYLWLIWLVITLLCLLGGWLCVEFAFNIVGGPL